jgi:hypothetical protein
MRLDKVPGPPDNQFLPSIRSIIEEHAMFKVTVLVLVLTVKTTFAGDPGGNMSKSIAPARAERALPREVAKPKAQGKAPPRGNVVWVDAARNLVWINLGQADGIGPRAKLQVGQQQDDEILKGQIEVTRVLAPRLAEARILSQEVKESIDKGDPIIP